MHHRQTGESLAGQARRSSRMTMVLLTIPVIISLVALLAYAVRYSQSFTRMERVAVLKPMVGVTLPEQIWSAVAGRSSYAACGAEETTEEIYATLRLLTEGSTSDGRTLLTVAGRTMDTMTAYMARIHDNLHASAPVAENELILDEIRAVAALVESMLEDYITVEIDAISALNRVLSRLVVVVAVLEALLLAITLIVANWNARRMIHSIREPIRQLEHFAGILAEGNLQARVPATDIVELQSLTDSVNLMADRLDTLMAQSRQEQENLKKAELRTLQAQINPHFLYNTLDAIVWEAEAGRSDEVITITRALSDFFRISLSSGADWITLAQEMKHLSGYLAIQKIRYRDILNYVIDVPEDIGGVYVLKLLLQPLVENAIYHGIKYRRGGGTITITGRMEGGELSMCVHDTGRGMDAGRLEEVRRQMRTSTAPYAQDGSGFGLNNVDHRIRLYYGQETGLMIDSDDSGTSVSFRVPVKQMKEEQA